MTSQFYHSFGRNTCDFGLNFQVSISVWCRVPYVGTLGVHIVPAQFVSSLTTLERRNKEKNKKVAETARRIKKHEILEEKVATIEQKIQYPQKSYQSEVFEIWFLQHFFKAYQLHAFNPSLRTFHTIMLVWNLTAVHKHSPNWTRHKLCRRTSQKTGGNNSL